MVLHIQKHLINQVDLINILQEFIAVNDRIINFFGKEVCTLAIYHLLLLESVHIFQHQNFRYFFYPIIILKDPLTPI